MQSISKRNLMTGSAALAVAAVVPAVSAQAGAGELAALIRAYRTQCDIYEAAPEEDDVEAELELASQIMHPALRKIYGVPARCDEDALAAIDLLIFEGRDCAITLNGEGIYDQLTNQLVHAVRDYLAGRVSA